MKPALQTATVEQEYETFDGLVRVKRYYHWGRRRWITRKLLDPGRRKPDRSAATQGYSAIRIEGK